MRVLLCSHVYPPDRGGVATFASDLAALLQSSRSEVKVLHELGGGDGACRVGASLIHRYRRGRISVPLRFLHFFCAAAKVRPDVVVCSTWLYYGLPAVQFARLFGYKVVIQVHGTEIRGRFRQGRRHQYLMRVLNAADLLWPNSHFTANLLAEDGCARDRLQVVSPFLSNDLVQSARAYRDSPRDQPPLILTAGHLYPRKGIDLVLQALSLLPDLAWQYTIVGEEALPGYRRHYEAMARELDIAARVRFLGYLPRAELWALMARASIFVMTSRADADDIESFGIVYIEAQAFGAACVGARVGGVPEAVGDGGILVPPENPEALAAALRELLVHPGRTRRLGLQGRERVLASFTEAARRAEIMPCLASLGTE